MKWVGCTANDETVTRMGPSLYPRYRAQKSIETQLSVLKRYSKFVCFIVILMFARLYVLINIVKDNLELLVMQVSILSSQIND